MDEIISGIFCCECGEESIRTDGKCLNCRAMNHIYECERCGNIFVSDEKIPTNEELALCHNCLEFYENE